LLKIRKLELHKVEADSAAEEDNVVEHLQYLRVRLHVGRTAN
jgi:hypothetical protein